jgi:hypothetical protein
VSALGRLRSAMKASPLLSIAAVLGMVLMVALLGRTILPPSESPPASPASVAPSPIPTPRETASIAASPESPASTAPSADASLAPGVVPVATSAPGGGGDALAAGTLGGRTHPGGACFWLGEGSRRVALVWPFGFTALTDPLRLVGGDRQVLARRGDHVQLGGGGPPVDYVLTPAQDPCKTGDVFAVSSVVSVNGAPLEVYGGVDPAGHTTAGNV